MTDSNEVPGAEGAVRRLLAAGQLTGGKIVHKAGAATLALLPEGYSALDITATLEAAAKQPNRPAGTVRLNDLESFLAYCMSVWETGARLYVDTPNGVDIAAGMPKGAGQFVAVLNDEGWADVRALYRPLVSEPWTAWTKAGQSTMGQTEFAELLEDRIDDIHAPAGVELITLVDNFSAARTASFGSKVQRANGSVRFHYNDEVTTGELVVPEFITLGIPVFDGGETYEVKARLRYRLNGGAVSFAVQMVRPDLVVRDALAQMLERCSALLQPVYGGVPVTTQARARKRVD